MPASQSDPAGLYRLEVIGALWKVSGVAGARVEWWVPLHSGGRHAQSGGHHLMQPHFNPMALACSWRWFPKSVE